MKKILHRHRISFQNAIEGIKWAISTQPNFRVHIALATAVVVSGLYLKLTPIEWTIIVFTIVLGLGAEMINTAIESMTDLITKEWRQEAKIAKDVAAGMMLTIAFGALIVAAFILGPKILSIFEFL